MPEIIGPPSGQFGKRDKILNFIRIRGPTKSPNPCPLSPASVINFTWVMKFGSLIFLSLCSISLLANDPSSEQMEICNFFSPLSSSISPFNKILSSSFIVEQGALVCRRRRKMMMTKRGTFSGQQQFRVGQNDQCS